MVADQQLKIFLASAELAPFAKTGGLADVASALSAYLYRAGHQIRVLMPRYAYFDASASDIVPMPGLQDLSMRIGNLTISYSIDVTELPGTGLDIYLLRCPPLYGRHGIYTHDDDEHLRFVTLSRAAIEVCQRTGFAPNIFHCHDWHTSLIPLYLRSVYAWDTLFSATRSVLTIHNIGYQGIFPASVLPQLGLDGAEHNLHQDDMRAGRINFLKTGVLYADLITTVSPTYAHEIQGAEYGMGLDGLLGSRSDTVIGILNGVDYSEWNPETDPLIPENYSRADRSGKSVCKRELMADLELQGGQDRPLIGIVSRLVGQKGFDLVGKVIPGLLTRRDFALAVLGSGERRFEQMFSRLQNAFRDRVCFYSGYSNKLAHWIEAGSDMFLMPSRYEPCGLNQMYSLRYGTVPIVRETGGLADSVELVDSKTGSGTGVVFRDYDEAGLAGAVNAGLDLYRNKPLWSRIIDNGMEKDFSWEHQGAHYVELFRRLSRGS